MFDNDPELRLPFTRPFIDLPNYARGLYRYSSDLLEVVVDDGIQWRVVRAIVSHSRRSYSPAQCRADGDELSQGHPVVLDVVPHLAWREDITTLCVTRQSISIPFRDFRITFRYWIICTARVTYWDHYQCYQRWEWSMPSLDDNLPLSKYLCDVVYSSTERDVFLGTPGRAGSPERDVLFAEAEDHHGVPRATLHAAWDMYKQWRTLRMWRPLLSLAACVVRRQRWEAQRRRRRLLSSFPSLLAAPSCAVDAVWSDSNLLSVVGSFVPSHFLVLFRLVCTSARDAAGAPGTEASALRATRSSLSHFVFRLPMLLWATRSHAPWWRKATFAFAAAAGDFHVLAWLHARRCPWDASACASAALAGRLDVLRWLRTRRCPYDDRMHQYAARNGHLDVVAWVRDACDDLGREERVLAHRALTYQAIETASLCGNPHVVEWVRLHGHDDHWNVVFCGAAWRGDVPLMQTLLGRVAPTPRSKACDEAARNGQRAALEWLRARGFGCSNDTCVQAAKNGHLDLLKWLVEIGAADILPEMDGVGADDVFDEAKTDACEAATEDGHLHVLQWVHAGGWGGWPSGYEATHCFIGASQAGNFDMVEWLYDTVHFPMLPEEFFFALSGGHVEILRWMHARSWPTVGEHESVCWEMIDGDDVDDAQYFEVVQWMHDEFGMALSPVVLSEAVRRGHCGMLRWLRALECPRDAGTCAVAARAGRTDVLEWVHTSSPISILWQEETCAAAARAGRIAVLEWAHSRGWRWGADACAHAAQGGHLRVLEWLHARGCPCDSLACRSAIESDHALVLEWLLRRGCPPPPHAITIAARGGDVHLMRILRASGMCECHDDTCVSAARGHHLHALRWARSLGCPLDVDACLLSCKASPSSYSRDEVVYYLTRLREAESLDAAWPWSPSTHAFHFHPHERERAVHLLCVGHAIASRIGFMGFVHVWVESVIPRAMERACFV